MRRLSEPINTLVNDDSISLSCTVLKNKYRLNSKVKVEFLVTNIKTKPIYLIIPEPDQITFSTFMKNKDDSWLNKDLYISIEQFQIYEEYFEMPSLKRLAPGETHSGQIQYRLTRYTRGAEFSIFLSVFYLNEEGMNEVERMMAWKSSKIGPDFRDLEISLKSKPITLSII